MARAVIVSAKAGLVANPVSGGTCAAAIRARSLVHAFGRYSARLKAVALGKRSAGDTHCLLGNSWTDLRAEGHDAELPQDAASSRPTSTSPLGSCLSLTAPNSPAVSKMAKSHYLAQIFVVCSGAGPPLQCGEPSAHVPVRQSCRPIWRCQPRIAGHFEGDRILVVWRHGCGRPCSREISRCPRCIAAFGAAIEVTSKFIALADSATGGPRTGLFRLFYQLPDRCRPRDHRRCRGDPSDRGDGGQALTFAAASTRGAY